MEVINCMSWCLQSEECCDACRCHFDVENFVNKLPDKQVRCIVEHTVDNNY